MGIWAIRRAKTLAQHGRRRCRGAGPLILDRWARYGPRSHRSSMAPRPAAAHSYTPRTDHAAFVPRFAVELRFGCRLRACATCLRQGFGDVSPKFARNLDERRPTASLAEAKPRREEDATAVGRFPERLSGPGEGSWRTWGRRCGTWRGCSRSRMCTDRCSASAEPRSVWPGTTW